MNRQETNEREFKRQGYFRLLAYVKPYWKRLAVGIAAGMIVGSSTFVTLMMIPRMIGVVELGMAEEDPRVRMAEELSTALESPEVNTPEARRSAVRKILLPPPDEDPKLTSLLQEAEKTVRRFHLPITIRGGTLHVFWPREFQFEIMGANGRVAWQLFAVYVIIFLAMWLLKNVAQYLNAYLTRWVGGRVVADLRNALFCKLMDQSLAFYGNMDTGQLISRCTNDTGALEYSVSHCVEELTRAPLELLGCLAAIVCACREYDNYSLIFILGIGFPVLLVPVQILGRRIRKFYKKTFSRIADVLSRMHESFMGIRVVKAYNAEGSEKARFIDAINRYFRQVVRSMRLQVLVAPTMELVAVSASMVFLLYSYRQGISITQLSSLLAPAFLAYRPLKEISKVISAVQQSMAAADRFFALLDTDTSLPEKPGAKEVTDLKESIELHHVTFRYEDRTIIDDISFRIPKGYMVGVVGETGSGKSTIANLIARFYDVSSGQVLIDGVDVRDCSIASLRKIIGVVNQEPILFNETIAANIAYGTPNATQEEIETAAKLANAHEFIVGGTHAEGYQTEVGENGFRLSGGEKQRVAIARAILRNPPILILDEATSALDNVTEKLVQEALTRVMANRTVFAIAHRLSTIQHANLILVLEHGRIVESGTHEELLEKNGVYRRLHDTQFAR